jgi:hypothetical protein
MVPDRLSPFPFLLFLVFAASAGTAYPDDTVLPLAGDLTAMLGWTPEEAFAWLGAPDGLFPFRDEAGEDCVVFYFEDHTYLFWYEDRVWQIRADRRWEGEVDGVGMGASRDEVRALWGPPINDFDPQPTWTLPDKGYPVRIRLYFDDTGKLTDLYVYRSDW